MPQTAAFANCFPLAQSGGLPYVNGVTLPNLEADLLSPAVPIVLPYKIGMAASVELTLSGTLGTNTSYVVMQTDFGDGAWYDLAWLLNTATIPGVYNYLLSAGTTGASVFQSRANGTPPGSTGSNACLLGSRIRFTGQKNLGGGSNPNVTAKIVYHPQFLR